MCCQSSLAKNEKPFFANWTADLHISMALQLPHPVSRRVFVSCLTVVDQREAHTPTSVLFLACPCRWWAAWPVNGCALHWPLLPLACFSLPGGCFASNPCGQSFTAVLTMASCQQTTQSPQTKHVGIVCDS